MKIRFFDVKTILGNSKGMKNYLSGKIGEYQEKLSVYAFDDGYANSLRTGIKLINEYFTKTPIENIQYNEAKNLHYEEKKRTDLNYNLCFPYYQTIGYDNKGRIREKVVDILHEYYDTSYDPEQFCQDIIGRTYVSFDKTGKVRKQLIRYNDGSQITSLYEYNGEKLCRIQRHFLNRFNTDKSTETGIKMKDERGDYKFEEVRFPQNGLKYRKIVYTNNVSVYQLMCDNEVIIELIDDPIFKRADVEVYSDIPLGIIEYTFYFAEDMLRDKYNDFGTTRNSKPRGILFTEYDYC